MPQFFSVTVSSTDARGEGALVHVLTWYANRHRSKAGYRSLRSRLNRLIERMGLNLLEALKRPFRSFADEDAGVDGKKVYIVRPCMIHGPGNKGNLNLLYGVEV